MTTTTITSFKAGQKVTGRTPRGREFDGKVSEVIEGKRGAFISVALSDGSFVKVRPSLLAKARTKPAAAKD